MLLSLFFPDFSLLQGTSSSSTGFPLPAVWTDASKLRSTPSSSSIDRITSTRQMKASRISEGFLQQMASWIRPRLPQQHHPLRQALQNQILLRQHVKQHKQKLLWERTTNSRCWTLTGTPLHITARNTEVCGPLGMCCYCCCTGCIFRCCLDIPVAACTPRFASFSVYFLLCCFLLQGVPRLSAVAASGPRYAAGAAASGAARGLNSFIGNSLLPKSLRMSSSICSGSTRNITNSRDSECGHWSPLRAAVPAHGVADDLECGALDLNSLCTSVVKVYSDFTDPNYALPWQMQRQGSSTGSGFIVHPSAGGGERIILTNAHCVAWNNRLHVRKHGSGFM